MAELCDRRWHRGEGVVIQIKVNKECKGEERRRRWDGFDVDTTHVK